jgi:hypothetical protein
VAATLIQRSTHRSALTVATPSATGAQRLAQGATSFAPRTLATGVSLPGAGLAPGLVVIGQGSLIVARSRSPMPLRVSTSARYGQPLHSWSELAPGESRGRIVLTGTRYSYCFAQTAGQGYAATRACGSWTLHENLNGARLPDGSPASSTFEFAHT